VDELHGLEQVEDQSGCYLNRNFEFFSLGLVQIVLESHSFNELGNNAYLFIRMPRFESRSLDVKQLLNIFLASRLLFELAEDGDLSEDLLELVEVRQIEFNVFGCKGLARLMVLGLDHMSIDTLAKRLDELVSASILWNQSRRPG